MRVAAAIVFSLIFPVAGIAAEEPEAVYAKFHRAAASGNLEEMVRYAHEAQRAEFAAMSAAQKDANAKMMAALLPRAFLLQQKTVNPDGKGARLLVSGPAGVIPGEKPEMLYGTISMVVERGEWKVGEMNWSNARPAGLGEGKPAVKPVAPAAKAQAAPAARGATTLGSTPERKLGTARPPCVYKPVMTAEDVENCR